MCCLGVKNDEDLKGVIPHSFDHIFSHIARTENQQYLVRASYLEIYMVGVMFYLEYDGAQYVCVQRHCYNWEMNYMN